MSNSKRDYDTTLARIAGNIAAGIMGNNTLIDGERQNEASRSAIAEDAVALARAIVCRAIVASVGDTNQYRTSDG